MGDNDLVSPYHRSVVFTRGAAVTERFLTFFDSDQRVAEKRFRELWYRLESFFRWRGRADSEDLAAEVIRRAVAALEQSLPVESDVVKYVFGIAEAIEFESKSLKRGDHRRMSRFLSVAHAGLHRLVRLIEVSQLLVDGLSPDDREILLRYCFEDRLRLSRDLRKSPAALRAQIANIRDRLRRMRVSVASPTKDYPTTAIGLEQWLEVEETARRSSRVSLRFVRLLDAMQGADAQARLRQAFDASPEEIGAASVIEARKRR